ncbi:hypothetical protein Sjap_024545 [Stephania japonica]|uniref:Uncharacterized protein n=1 Tax=Stephania japonica TaxID=461633 RepID=A0AAP0EIY2_9MAGN
MYMYAIYYIYTYINIKKIKNLKCKRPRRALGLIRKRIRLRGILVIWLPFSFNPKTTTTTQFIKRNRGKESSGVRKPREKESERSRPSALGSDIGGVDEVR